MNFKPPAGKPVTGLDFLGELWKRSPDELRQLAQSFAAKKMSNLADACRVIAEMKS